MYLIGGIGWYDHLSEATARKDIPAGRISNIGPQDNTGHNPPQKAIDAEQPQHLMTHNHPPLIDPLKQQVHKQIAHTPSQHPTRQRNTGIFSNRRHTPHHNPPRNHPHHTLVDAQSDVDPARIEVDREDAGGQGEEDVHGGEVQLHLVGGVGLDHEHEPGVDEGGAQHGQHRVVVLGDGFVPLRFVGVGQADRVADCQREDASPHEHIHRPANIVEDGAGPSGPINHLVNHNGKTVGYSASDPQQQHLEHPNPPNERTQHNLHNHRTPDRPIGRDKWVQCHPLPQKPIDEYTLPESLLERVHLDAHAGQKQGK